MNRINPREKMLLMLIGGIAFLFLNLLLFSSLKRRQAATAAEIASKRTELASLREINANSALSAERDAWLSAHQPKLANADQAGVQLLETIKQAARAGLGVSLLSRAAVEAELASGWLAEIRLRDAPLTRPWYVLRSAVGPDRPAVTQLLAYLRTAYG